MQVIDRIRQSRELLVITALLALVLGYLLLHLAHILTPFIVAAVFAYLVHPLVDWVERRSRLPRAFVIVILYVVLFGALVFAGVLVAPSLGQQVQSLAHLVPDIVETIEQRLARSPEIRIGEIVIDTSAVLDRLDAAAQALAERFSRAAVPLVLATVEALIKSFVFFLVSFYGLLQGRSLVARLRALAPRRHQRTVGRILSQVDATFRAYVRAQLVLFAIVATATYVALTILQIKYRLALAVATGLLELIPFVGPWTAGAIAVSVALTQGTAPFGWSALQLALVVAAVYLVLRILEDHFVIPQLVGHFVRLHPVVVLFGVLAGASVAGILGLLLAVPTLAALKIVVLSVLEELRHPPPRQILALENRSHLCDLPVWIASPARRDVVLIVPPGIVEWSDLPLFQDISRNALEHDVEVAVVTPDPVARSLATAVGLPVVSRLPSGWGAEAEVVNALGTTHRAPREAMQDSAAR
ncbi:AI-2E family transporter [Thermomicrobium sp. 4228-Ro]|uniref:AI-2E family transporter n=1 Tax=Thermomicrobium sp. 4228-Ro TaxID=2993937 RepID=UPI002248CCE5|nr:AI-2E family transporter [Thermomicrobium sp. 4228-Ro]MCX2727922.1 AI-2E family transporter [Thermomicrobium sp. 4228-Ro]